VLALFEEFGRLCKSTDLADRLKVKAIILNLLAEYIRLAGRQTKVFTDQRDEDMRNVLSYINENFRRNLTTEELAAVCHLHPTHFIRAFKTKTAQTPHQYITDIRMEYARQLLDFLDHAPSPYQSVELLSAMLDEAGAVRLEEFGAWSLEAGKLYYFVKDGTQITGFHLGSAPLAFLSIIVFGLGVPISSVANARWAADLYGDKGYASAVRSLNVAYTVGCLLFGPVPGMLADAFGGSYLPSYLLFIVLLAVSLILLRIVYGQLGAGKRR
jgi:AraC-like DNA-binding protein